MSVLPRSIAATALLGATLALAGCGGAKVGVPPSAGTATTTSTPTKSASNGTSASAAPAGTTGTTHEVADPEEASSYPTTGAVDHAAADSPRTAGEAIVAAGAPSNAEIRAELKQMKAARESASHAQQANLKPVPGGESVPGAGTIPIPSGVPEVIQKVIAGANEIADFPYVFGGGHASFIDNAYDCSGSVSYALAAGGLLSRPEVSGELEHWGAPGPGRYITVYATAGHAYMYVDGILFDTAGRSGQYDSRWQVTGTDNSGYVARHWPGL